jgi:hypothetical protein
MSKRVSSSVLVLTTLAFSLIIADVLVLAAQDPQNQPATPQTQTTTPKTKSPKRKRGQMKMTTPANETTTGDQATTPTDTTTPAQSTMPAQTMSSMASTQADLSGTYAGTFNCDALGLTGDTTLTINGNQFSTADGKTGRIVGSTTHGYTAVALQTGDVPTGATTTPGAATTTPTIVSLRARKSGNRLTLMPVAGSTMQCSFMPGRSVARTRRSRQRTPAATGAEVSNPATTMPNPAATPAQPAPENPTPAQTPSPTPGPSPSPGASPTPGASPSPGGSPEPSPGASPMPSPTPSPSPRPRG